MTIEGSGSKHGFLKNMKWVENTSRYVWKIIWGKKIIVLWINSSRGGHELCKFSFFLQIYLFLKFNMVAHDYFFQNSFLEYKTRVSSPCLYKISHIEFIYLLRYWALELWRFWKFLFMRKLSKISKGHSSKALWKMRSKIFRFFISHGY